MVETPPAPNDSAPVNPAPPADPTTTQPAKSAPALDFESLPISKKHGHHHHHKSHKSHKKSKKKKKQSSGVSEFLDESAGVGSDEEEDNPSDAEITGKEAEELNKMILAQKHRALAPIEQVIRSDNYEDYKKYDEGLKERMRPVEIDIKGNFAVIGEKVMLPSTMDPPLWMIKTKKGMEKVAAISLMNKFFCFNQEKKDFLILSAMSVSAIKGAIYVEAFKENYVKQAIEGMHCFLPKITLVPLEERLDILKLGKAKKQEIKPKMWVRVKSGQYGGDLAQIVSVNTQQKKATIKLIPRIDFGGFGKKLEANARPPQKLLNIEELGKSQVTMTKDKITSRRYYEWNNMRFRKGFYFKEINIRSLNLDVTPTLSELQAFKPLASKEDEFSSEDEKMNFEDILIIAQKRGSGVVKGDKVRIAKGEMKDIFGVVSAVSGTIATITPDTKELPMSIDIPVADLEKAYREGDFVKVVNGKYKGESGLITYTEKNILHIILESKKATIEVLASDVIPANEAGAEPTDSPANTKFAVNDLVAFNNGKNAGIILSISRDMITLMDVYGQIKTFKKQDLVFQKDTNRVTDSERHELSRGDEVRIIEGEHKNLKGAIIHTYKTFVFLYSVDVHANSGIFVERNRNLRILGADLLAEQAPNEQTTEERKLRGMSTIKTPVYVVISKGTYKGKQGVILECDKKSAKIELSAKAKIVTVAKDEYMELDKMSKEEKSAPFCTVDSGQSKDIVGSKTPAYPQSPSYYNPNLPSQEPDAFR